MKESLRKKETMKTSRQEILSSGRWDAIGSLDDSIQEEINKTFIWANTRTNKELRDAIKLMAEDTNAFTLYERRALLEIVAFKLEEL